MAGISPFWELDIKAPIRKQLADTVVLEYPVIHVHLPSEHYDFEIVRKNLPADNRRESKDSNIANNEIQKGVTFREEEIKENGSSSDPQVFDLMNHVHQISPQSKSEKTFGNSVLSLTRAGAGNRVHSSPLAKVSGIFEDMEFEFDQGLLYAYSDLIAKMNPDDFLDLEGENAKQPETEDRRDLSNSRGVFFAEELEEGEIVD
ncbi:uncharacterized protein LOC120204495 [Hibiscus syriacus]|uniref:uncharacterized protein LOC120204495 n=1 Tax=Hibiscus syriacus TaxID=106335 RepID=UPI00192194A0|nr:uncharacterized protein LOC120204495 [Hibiscus syriacus]